MKKHAWAWLCGVAVSVSLLSGCSWTQRGTLIGAAVGSGIGAIAACENHPAVGTAIGAAGGAIVGALVGDQFDQKNARDLRNQIKNLQDELNVKEGVIKDKDKEIAELKDRIKELEKEIAELRKKLGERVAVKREGMVIVAQLLAETHYRPGRGELNEEGMKELDRAVRIIKEQFPDREIVARGHTDSDPIKYSGWKSNWELGSARALGALHYLMDKHGIKGEMISAQTFSKYRPAADNSTADGKKQNRRVEICVLPKTQPKIERYSK